MKRHKAIWVPVLLVLCLPVATAQAQTRSRVRSGRAVVGDSGVRLGDTAASRSFRTHSYGLSGAVSRSPSATGYLNRHRTTANLRSSSFNLRRPSAPIGPGGYNAPAVRPMGSTIRRYGTGPSASSLSGAALPPRPRRSTAGNVPGAIGDAGAMRIPSAAGSIPSAGQRIPSAGTAVPSAGRIPRLPATRSGLPSIPRARTHVPPAGATVPPAAGTAGQIYTRPTGGPTAVPRIPMGTDRRSVSQALRRARPKPFAREARS